MSPRNLALAGASLLLAVTLPAQGALPLTYRIDADVSQVTFAIEYPYPATHVLLAAWDGRTNAFGLLADAAVLAIVPKAENATLVLPVPATLLAGLGLHLQTVALDGDRSVAGPELAASTAFDPTPFKKAEPDYLGGVLANLSVRVEKLDVRPGTWFVAEYPGLGDDYALRAAAVVRHDNVQDVYLTLRTPAPVTGRRVVVVDLRTDVQLDPTAQLVRVFVVAGPSPYMLPLGAYLPFRQLPMPR